jgi:putative ABC transport system permease protein
MITTLRQTLRSALKDRRYVLGVVLLLTVGGGGAVSLIAFLRAFVFAPFDFPAEQILVAHGRFAGGARTGLSAGMAPALAATGAFSHTATIASGRPQLQAEVPRQLSAAHVTSEFFDIFQVPSALGSVSRLPSDPRAVVISYDLWRGLGSDPAIVGKTLNFDDGAADVVAVAPQGFNIPAGTDVWRPLTISAGAAAQRGPGPFSIYLSAAQPIERARAAAGAVAAPDANDAKFTVGLERLTDDVSLGFMGPVRLLASAVVVLIVTTLANVYLLSAARARRLAPSTAIHVSLGASRRVLAFRALIEVTGIVALGCTGALLVSSWLFEWLSRAAPAYLTEIRSEPVHISLVWFGASMFVACGSMALFGLLPWRHLARGAQPNGVRGAAGRASRRHLGLIVALQLATATAVVGTTLTLVKTYFRENLGAARPTTSGVVTFEVWASPFKYRTGADRASLFTNVLTTLDRHPGVRGAALTSHLPFGPLSPSTASVSPDDQSATASAVVMEVTQGFFGALNIGLRPRIETLADTQEGAVISRSLARALFRANDPVGRAVLIGRGKMSRILGVADDVDLGFRQKASGFVFLIVAPKSLRGSIAKAVVRLDGPAGADTVAIVRDAVRVVDAHQPLTRLQTLPSAIQLLDRAPRFRMMVFLFAAVLAIAVSTIGVAAMQGYYLAQRRTEFALRSALGAGPHALLRLGLGTIVPSIAIGCGAGSTFVLYSSRTLLVFDASRAGIFADALTGVGAVVAIAACACVPALIAALRVPPRELLNAE